MAEVLVEFTDPIENADGGRYIARACAGPADNGMWQGWIEFLPTTGGEVLRSGRETTQPNRDAAMYWATGLTAVYLEGALERALRPLERPAPDPNPRPVYEGPAPEPVPAPPQPDAVLNPFSVIRKGEAQLRSQLGALAPWHLVNVVRAYDLSDLGAAALGRMTATELIELIVAAVRSRQGTAALR
jgi:hypothetical protein